MGYADGSEPTKIKSRAENGRKRTKRSTARLKLNQKITQIPEEVSDRRKL